MPRDKKGRLIIVRVWLHQGAALTKNKRVILPVSQDNYSRTLTQLRNVQWAQSKWALRVCGSKDVILSLSVFCSVLFCSLFLPFELCLLLFNPWTIRKGEKNMKTHLSTHWECEKEREPERKIAWCFLTQGGPVLTVGDFTCEEGEKYWQGWFWNRTDLLQHSRGCQHLWIPCQYKGFCD